MKKVDIFDGRLLHDYCSPFFQAPGYCINDQAISQLTTSQPTNIPIELAIPNPNDGYCNFVATNAETNKYAEANDL
jgi:hypothetical protein